MEKYITVKLSECTMFHTNIWKIASENINENFNPKTDKMICADIHQDVDYTNG